MARMLTVGLVALAVLVAGCGSDGTFERVDDTPENRAAAAERLEATMPVTVLIEDMVYDMSRHVADEKQDDFLDYMANAIDYAAMRDITLEAMTRHYTANELNAQAAFYESPEGRAVYEKSRGYMADLMPRIHARLAEKANAWMNDQWTPDADTQ